MGQVPRMGLLDWEIHPEDTRYHDCPFCPAPVTDFTMGLVLHVAMVHPEEFIPDGLDTRRRVPHPAPSPARDGRARLRLVRPLPEAVPAPAPVAPARPVAAPVAAVAAPPVPAPRRTRPRRRSAPQAAGQLELFA